jgi:hypothetical protein
MSVPALARDLTVLLLQSAEVRVTALLAEPSVLVASSHAHPPFLGVSRPASSGPASPSLLLPALPNGGPWGALAVLRGHVATADSGAVRAPRRLPAARALRPCHTITPLTDPMDRLALAY